MHRAQDSWPLWLATVDGLQDSRVGTGVITLLMQQILSEPEWPASLGDAVRAPCRAPWPNVKTSEPLRLDMTTSST